MKAMILSAGFGTRLKPFTDNLPKALVPYNKIPMINYQIERMKKAGIEEIVVNAHHHSDKIVSYFNKNNFGIKIDVLVEEEILGTGGGVLNAKKYFKDEDFFLVVNVDIETDINFSEMISYHKSQNQFATIAVQKRKTKRYLEFDTALHLIGRENKSSIKENLFAFNGVHAITNRIFEKNFEIKFADILNIYLEVIKDKVELVLGYDTGKSTFKDLGKIENLSS